MFWSIVGVWSCISGSLQQTRGCNSNFKMVAEHTRKGRWVSRLCWQGQGNVIFRGPGTKYTKMAGLSASFSSQAFQRYILLNGEKSEHDWGRFNRTWHSWRIPKVSFYLKAFFVCWSLLENQKPYDCSLTSLWNVYIFPFALSPFH